MNWVQFVTIWNEIKEKIALQRVRTADDKKIAETLKRAQT
jgi:phage regulator Rha-like protein